MQLHRPLILSTLAAAAAALLPLGAAHAAGVPGQGTWETTLQPRDINGDGTVDAFYDTVLNVSWLADANAGAGSVYDSAIYSSPTDGLMNWTDAKAWAANLDVYGTTGWRLPTMIDTGASGCDWSTAGGTDCGYNVQTISLDGKTVFSELAHLYYVSLGNKGECAPGDANCNPGQPGWGLTNTGAFRNLQVSRYWSGVAYAPYPLDVAWFFSTYYGYQNSYHQSFEISAVAVRPGDVTAVPEPQTYALLLVGVAGVLVAVRRRSI